MHLVLKVSNYPSALKLLRIRIQKVTNTGGTDCQFRLSEKTGELKQADKILFEFCDTTLSVHHDILSVQTYIL